MSTRRESRYVRFAKLAYEITLQTFEPYTHVKSKHVFTQPQLASCVLVMFYLDLSYRDMEEWLLASSEMVSALRLKRIPDHTTLCRNDAVSHVQTYDPGQDSLHGQPGSCAPEAE